MQPIDVTEQVQEVVCQIATRQVRETIPLEGTKHIVFYCALDTNLEIRQAEGEDAVLEGTLNAIGLTPEKARESVEGIEIGADQVDYFFASGPHEGEVFMGTRERNGQPESMSMGSGQIWRAYFLGAAIRGVWQMALRRRMPFPRCKHIPAVCRLIYAWGWGGPRG